MHMKIVINMTDKSKYMPAMHRSHLHFFCLFLISFILIEINFSSLFGAVVSAFGGYLISVIDGAFLMVFSLVVLSVDRSLLTSTSF